MNTMRPEPDDVAIHIPMTFDYRGGRNENLKGKVLGTIGVVIVYLIIAIGMIFRDSMDIVTKVIAEGVLFLVASTILRFIIWKEQGFSDSYESLKEVDFAPETSCFWQIYDIDYDYPYICHYTNGYKGIFVQMQKDVVVGKSDDIMYQHFEGISEAYNLASSLNIDMYHIDYMDNVGNDPRLAEMYRGLEEVENPDMQDMLIDMYQHLSEEMSRDYSSFDIYLFYTKDKIADFQYNVRSVCSKMLGGNYLTYKILDSNHIRELCMSLLNLHEFSAVQASECLLKNARVSGIVPIKVTHADGSEEKINKTVEEKRIEREEQERKKANDKLRRKEMRKAKKSGIEKTDDDLDLFE